MSIIWIADDEEIERKSLRMLLQNHFEQVVKIGEATNGFELLDAVRKENPDLLLIDISMPGLNGLEAIKELSMMKTKAKIIVVTAHSEFEYAQEALKSHVFDYLVKPFRRERMIDAVSKCLQAIQDEKAREITQTQMQEMMQTLKPIIRNELITSIMLGNTDVERMQTFFSIIGLHTQRGLMMTFFFQTPQSDQSEMDSMIHMTKLHQVAKDLASNAETFYDAIASPFVDQKISFLIPVKKELPPYQQKILSIELAELLIKQARREDNCHITVGIGRSYALLEEMHASYIESTAALRCTEASIKIRHYEDLFDVYPPRSSLFEHCADSFLALIKDGNLSALSKAIANTFATVSEQQSLENIKADALEWLATLNQQLHLDSGLQRYDANLTGRLFTQLQAVDTLMKLQSFMISQLDTLIQDHAQRLHMRSDGCITKAIDIIQTRYWEPLSLESVSEEVGISPYYFSRLFKQHRKENFVAYLTRVRLENAQRLLFQTKLPIREIALQVGYPNDTYFCKLFKKTFGMTVNEYRRQG